ncbi:hypothetical protein A5892_10595 [Halotalea alkalilenta]|uniref:Uncharacterized protein n=2 Tax=Halotalea alkalilenta TaxID=376489 RepID=A0A172YFG3_9GAMM|nr:hypothetical protein A5892_10595 [Halotalea alkalilenta]
MDSLMTKAEWTPLPMIPGGGSDDEGLNFMITNAGARHALLAMASGAVLLLSGCASQQTNEAIQGTAEITRAVLQVFTL